MPVLVSSESGLAEDLPQNVADSALQTGSHEIPLNDPEGNPVTAPIAEAKSLISQGYTQPSTQQLSSLISHAKHSTLPEQIKTGLEGAASATTFGLSTGAETEMGVNPEDIRARRETNPGIHALGQLAGLAGSAFIPGVGEANILKGAGEGLAGAIGLASKSGLIAKIGEGAVKGAFETALMAGGDEVSRMFSQDPNQSAESAIQDIGLSALLGGGIGGIAGGVMSRLGKSAPPQKFISQMDRAGVEAGDFKSTIEASSDLPESEKLGIIQELKKQKENAPAIKKAAERQGFPILEGIISDSDQIQKAEDALINGPPTYSSLKRQKLYNDAYQAVKSSVDTALGSESAYTKAELGNIFKDTITKDLEAQSEPINAIYNEIKQYHQAIPLSERSAPAIARNIGELKELRLSPSSPEGALANRVIKEIENLKTVDDVKEYKSILNRSISPTASSGEKRMIAILGDKLTDLEENSIIRFAKNNMKTPEARERILSLIDQRDAANKQYRTLMEKVKTLSEQLGKGRVYGIKDAVNFIKERLSPEEVTQRLFSKNNSEFLSFFKKEFPDQMNLMSDYQRGIIREEASKTGELIPSNVFKKVNALEPEIQKSIFNPEDLSKINDAETYLQAFPKKFNPSGTSHMSAFRAFFEHPMGATIANVRDLGIEGFIKLSQVSPEFKNATKLAAATIRGDNAVGKGASAIFNSAKNVVPHEAALSKEDRDKLKEKLDSLGVDPDKLIDVGSKNSSFPEYDTAFGQISARAVMYLAELKPKTDKMGPLDPDRTPSRVEEYKYDRALDIAERPVAVLNGVKDGSITMDDVRTIKTLYPRLYDRMSQKITHEMIDHVSKGNPVPYSTRIGLSIFLGQPLDASLTPQAIRAAQPKPAQQAMQAQSPQGGGRAHSMAHLGKMNSMYMTPDQSRMAAKLKNG